MNEPYIKPSAEPIQAFGRTCIKHPAFVVDPIGSWHRVTIAVIRSGQSAPYSDTVYMADVCFDGAGPTTKGGIDSPFFTNPPEKRVREFAFWLTGAMDPPNPFGPQLTQCEKIAEGETLRCSHRWQKPGNATPVWTSDVRCMVSATGRG